MNISPVVPSKHRGVLAAVLLSLFLAFVLAPSVARAAMAGPAPAWTITSFSSPTRFAPGEPTNYIVRVLNTGGAASDGSEPITITDALPSQLTLVPGGNSNAEGFEAYRVRGAKNDASESTCEPGPPATCKIANTVVQPGEAVWMIVPVSAAPGPEATVLNRVSVSGGGAAGASAVESTLLSTVPSPFAFQSLTSSIDDFSGTAETSAGARPYSIRLGFQLDTNVNAAEGVNPPAGAPRNVRTVLPAGMVVDPDATPTRCTEQQLQEGKCPLSSAVGRAYLTTSISEGWANPNGVEPLYNMVPPPGVAAELGFNAAGVGFPVHLLGGVDPAGDYALSADVKEILQKGNASGAVVELWGNPSDPSHDAVRGNCSYDNFDENTGASLTCPTSPSSVPFLTMPSACSGPLVTDFEIESWDEPAKRISAGVATTDSAGNPVGVGGCGNLEFNPSLQAQPQTTAPDSPTGLHVSLRLPQHEQIVSIKGVLPPRSEVQQVEFAGNPTSGEFTAGFFGDSTGLLPFDVSAAELQSALEALPSIGSGNIAVSGGPGGTKPFTVRFQGTLANSELPQLEVAMHSTTKTRALVTTLIDGNYPGHEGVLGSEGEVATATLRDLTVTLPQGLVVNPSAAGGQGACSLAQIGLHEPGAPQCPDDSKLGTVSLTTPLLDHPLPGSIYLARQGENPFGSLIALYVVIDDPISGVIVKLAGKVTLDQSTGQLTATFQENPQLPFDELSTEFFGGGRAALTTPATCGSYTTASDLTPWSAPEGKDAYPSDSFTVGGTCARSEGEEPNAPSFEAGTVTPLSGVFSPFVFKVSRENGSQHFKSINVTLPLGLVGKLAGVQQCSQAQIEAAEHRSHEGEGGLEQQNPSCPAGSELGTVTVGAGSGSPLYVTGHAYLAGPYEGAPFSAVVITPAVAGPFDLGVVVVRAALYINPETAQVTIKSDPFPTILDGIPLDIRSVAVNVSRNQFMFNPTSCEAQGVTGELLSTTGSVAKLSNHFQVGGCAGLAFKPKFTVATSAKTSKADGASLNVKLTPPAQGPLNNTAAGREEANVRYVKVELPKALPSRLTTLQKACTAAQFDANPAGCPAASRVGTAVVHTPVLANPLVGPAYFVSHGNEAFPQLIVVLQGEGITVDLAGDTFISKAGVTSSTFKSIPDVPVSSFELSLPKGPYSALTANTNLCAKPLTMPTEFVGQNGAPFKQSTAIEVEGCPNALSFTHKIKKKTLTLSVYAPAAGKITTTAKGLATKTKTAKGRETLTITLKQKKAGKLKTTVKVAFTPSTGKDRKKQTKNARLTFKK